MSQTTQKRLRGFDVLEHLDRTLSGLPGANTLHFGTKAIRVVPSDDPEEPDLRLAFNAVTLVRTNEGRQLMVARGQLTQHNPAHVHPSGELLIAPFGNPSRMTTEDLTNLERTLTKRLSEPRPSGTVLKAGVQGELALMQDGILDERASRSLARIIKMYVKEDAAAPHGLQYTYDDVLAGGVAKALIDALNLVAIPHR